MTVFTIGHSTRPIETFLELLAGHRIQHLVDIRKIPRSRHNPQFAEDRLAESLRAAHMRYTHMRGPGRAAATAARLSQRRLAEQRVSRVC